MYSYFITQTSVSKINTKFVSHPVYEKTGISFLVFYSPEVRRNSVRLRDSEAMLFRFLLGFQAIIAVELGRQGLLNLIIVWNLCSYIAILMKDTLMISLVGLKKMQAIYNISWRLWLGWRNVCPKLKVVATKETAISKILEAKNRTYPELVIPVYAIFSMLIF